MPDPKTWKPLRHKAWVDFNRKLFSDTKLLKKFCAEPAETLRSAGVDVPDEMLKALPRTIDYGKTQDKINTVITRYGSFDGYLKLHNLNAVLPQVESWMGPIF